MGESVRNVKWEKQKENQDLNLQDGIGLMWIIVGFVKTEIIAISVDC